MTAAAAISDFIHRWKPSGASERANYVPFLSELCNLLGVPQPEPTTPDVTQNAYVFEREVTFHHTDGTTTTGRIDLYKRGSFVLEAKQGSDQADAEAAAEAKALAPKSPVKKSKKGTAIRGTKSWDDAMVKARGQADRYARALPVEEGWPPFLVVLTFDFSVFVG